MGVEVKRQKSGAQASRRLEQARPERHAMAGGNNVIPLQAHPRARAFGEAGAALDVVAQLFDQVNRDEALPTAVRAELARLRIPTLRAAQVSPDVLVSRGPTRRLVDAIGAAALGL